MTTNVERYQRIAPVYDLLDLPFEARRYRALRPLLFDSLAGYVLDAGIGTGRNCEFYPPAAIVSGIDISIAMLARARERCPTLAAADRLYRMDVTALEFPRVLASGLVGRSKPLRFMHVSFALSSPHLRPDQAQSVAPTWIASLRNPEQRLDNRVVG